MPVNSHAKPLKNDQSVTLQTLIDDPEKRYFLARVDGSLYELRAPVPPHTHLDFLDVTHDEAIYTYEASLRYLVAMAIHRMYPQSKIKFSFSVSRGVYIEFITQPPKLSLKAFKRQLENELDDLIALDLPIRRQTVSKEKAKALFSALGFNEKIELLHYRPEPTVHVYACEDYYNYMYHHMVPSTGYLHTYRLSMVHPGLILEAPRAEFSGRIPPFQDEPVFKEMLKEANRRNEKLDTESVLAVNRQIIETPDALIQASENEHLDALDAIRSHLSVFKKVRLIALTGPSSSGKTTFTHKLAQHLSRHGLHAVTISLDHYYLNRADLKTVDGHLDLETIHALDIERFKSDIASLIDTHQAMIPFFDFTTGTRTHEDAMHIDASTYICIEGIHALNPRLTEHLNKAWVFKIFISPHLQIRLDPHNPMRITAVRLLRRIVRDIAYRNTDAMKTFAMWDRVRAGEFKWIYPYLEDADYVFNSALPYEMGVLKPFVMDALQKVERENEHFITANRLIKYLKHFKTVDASWVPKNSVLREFIGGLEEA